MTASLPQVLTLEEFLNLPYLEDSPAWEYANGVATQKPMPKTRHSMLQKRLLTAIDDAIDILPTLEGWGFWGQTVIAGFSRLTSPKPMVDAPTI
jgi:Uma2 family endonuclease